ncbi:hypothetical protein C8J56DRAFT_836198, partial [Mycena floridula]
MPGTIDLFPPPCVIPPSRISPSVWPGVSTESTAALQGVLKENHEKWNIFFNDRGFHNHITHHVLAIWALGAPKSAIEAAYERDSLEQIPAFESPEPITVHNFEEHLGDRRFWKAYNDFFKNLVEKEGVDAVIEEYIFSQKANFHPSLKAGQKHPQMFDRFLASLLHPMIHLGYGAEFSLPGMVVEGLAETAVHEVQTSACLQPLDLFHTSSVTEKLASQVQSALRLDSTIAQGTHAFTILSRILKDPQFDPATKQPNDMTQIFSTTMKNHGAALAKYAAAWTVDTSNPKDIERKIEEIQWMNTVIFGVAGWSKSKEFNSDFFSMHLVTSSLFLPSLAAKLSPVSQGILLRGYFAASLAWWVARGRPAFDIAGFFAADTAHPTPPSGHFPKLSHAILSLTSDIAAIPNPWFPIIQMGITTTDDHVPKLFRALAHYSKLYGLRTAGLPDFSNTGLPGAEKLDGSLFIRVAGLAAARIDGKKDHGIGEREWDRHGYYA